MLITPEAVRIGLVNPLKLTYAKENLERLNSIFSQPTAKGVERELSKYIIEIENKIKELEK